LEFLSDFYAYEFRRLCWGKLDTRHLDGATVAEKGVMVEHLGFDKI